MSDPLVRRRKLAVQSRSAATVSALLDATIQVLAATGCEGLTTTRVAERAGASVGTLYQYFPDREALIAAAVERNLLRIEADVEAECAALAGAPLQILATRLVDTLVAAKWRHLDALRALHSPVFETKRAEMAETFVRRGVEVVARLLRSCADAQWDDVEAVTLFLMSASASFLQTAVKASDGAIDRETLREHLQASTLGYLGGLARPKIAAPDRLAEAARDGS